MTPEEENKALKFEIEKLTNKLQDERVNHHTLLRYAQLHSDQWKEKFEIIFDSSRFMGKQIAVILHLEREIAVRDAVIEKYLKHYQKYGKLYTDFDEKKKRECDILQSE